MSTFVFHFSVEKRFQLSVVGNGFPWRKYQRKLIAKFIIGLNLFAQIICMSKKSVHFCHYFILLSLQSQPLASMFKTFQKSSPDSSLYMQVGRSLKWVSLDDLNSMAGFSSSLFKVHDPTVRIRVLLCSWAGFLSLKFFRGEKVADRKEDIPGREEFQTFMYL